MTPSQDQPIPTPRCDEESFDHPVTGVPVVTTSFARTGQSRQRSSLQLPMSNAHSLPLVDGAFFVSSSFLDTLSCPRESYYYKIRAKVLASKGAGLQFGTHLHNALALHYRLQEFSLSPSQIHSRVVCLLEEAFLSSPTPEGDFRTLNWAVTIYEQYCKRFSEDQFDLLKWKEPRKCKQCFGLGFSKSIPICIWCNGTGRQTLMVEVPFVVKLFDFEPREPEVWFAKTGYFGFPVFYHGIIDLPIQRGKLKHVLDFKSGLRLGDDYWADKKMISQPKGYCRALGEVLQEPIHGYFIRALRTKEPPDYMLRGEPSKKGEIKKMEDWWNESLGEQRYDLGPGELDEWKDNAIELVEQFLWHYGRGYFPQNKCQCVRKYGKCQYYRICETFPQSDREMILTSMEYEDKKENTQLTMKEQNE